MKQSIFIIGGLKDDPDRELLLRDLRQRTGEEVEWEWYQALESEHYRLPRRLLFRLIGGFGQAKDSGTQTPKVVKLHLLHQQTQNSVYKTDPNPVLVPKDVDSTAKLIEWLLSAEANLVPRLEWWGNAQEAAIVAILAKLVRHKRWNKDTQGHAWTKEEKLLGQAPVKSPKRPQLEALARKLLPDLKGKLLLCKGGTGGGTPKEWSILLPVLPMVKQAILSQSITHLANAPQMRSIIERAGKDENRCYPLHEEVVSERVRQICRDR
jgi:hypothetical protein